MDAKVLTSVHNLCPVFHPPRERSSSCLGLAREPAMPANRLSLRLGQLPHDVLADLAARLCSESPALQAIADECIAAHKQLPHELVEGVLLSPDLVPRILGPLGMGDAAAAAVCSQWLLGWTATNETPWRRRLKRVPLELPEELAGMLARGNMADTPDGRLVVSAGSQICIFDRSTGVLQTVPGAWDGFIAANDDSIFIVVGTNLQTLRRSSHDGTTIAEYQRDGDEFRAAALSEGGCLFCIAHNHDEMEDEIIALDARTMQPRHRFGLGLLNDPHHLIVVGDELYVCDTGNDRLQVFSLTGEHRRSVTGEWSAPKNLCFARDRLYLIERDPSERQGFLPDGSHNLVQGRRVLVLSLQGDILQVFEHLTEPFAKFYSICCFGDTLLAGYHTGGIVLRYGSPPAACRRMLALQGL